jgi:hypothetical protein
MEIQNGAVAKSYMRKGFLIYEEMRKYLPLQFIRRPLVIYGYATAPFWISLLYEENLIFFLSIGRSHLYKTLWFGGGGGGVPVGKYGTDFFLLSGLDSHDCMKTLCLEGRNNFLLSLWTERSQLNKVTFCWGWNYFFLLSGLAAHTWKLTIK